jgi:hypothetical protein
MLSLRGFPGYTAERRDRKAIASRVGSIATKGHRYLSKKKEYGGKYGISYDGKGESRTACAAPLFAESEKVRRKKSGKIESVET